MNKESNVYSCQCGRNTHSIYCHTPQRLPVWKAKWENERFSRITDLFIYVFIHSTTNYGVELYLCSSNTVIKKQAKYKTKPFLLKSLHSHEYLSSKTFLENFTIVCSPVPQVYIDSLWVFSCFHIEDSVKPNSCSFHVSIILVLLLP